jgi:hypothetical protein
MGAALHAPRPPIVGLADAKGGFIMWMRKADAKGIRLITLASTLRYGGFRACCAEGLAPYLHILNNSRL